MDYYLKVGTGFDWKAGLDHMSLMGKAIDSLEEATDTGFMAEISYRANYKN